MSGQYPCSFTNPAGSHRGNFGNQMVPMNMGGNMPGNQMGMMNYMQGAGTGMGLVSGQGMSVHSSTAGMHSPSLNPQQQVNQQQMQVQQQQQQQQVQQQQNQLSLQTPTTPNTGNVPSMMGQQPPGGGPNMIGGNMPPQSGQQKEFNMVSLCKFGQETVQDIVSRFQEVFQALRATQPPNGTSAGSTEKKVQEQFRTIRLLFKRVRILYDKCNDSCQQGMEYTHVESLIPLKDEPDHKPEPAPSEEYKKALQENRELLETVMLKNKQLREVIDRIRIIIWEINTMLSMRRS